MASISVYHLDDDPFYGEQFKETLLAHTQEDLNIQTFLESSDLLKAIEKESDSCVVVLDIHMGEGAQQGDELVKAIRQNNPRAIIIMCSELNDPETVRHCLSIGADDFLFKGLDEHGLANRIVTAFKFFKNTRSDDSQLNFPSTTLSNIEKRIPNIINSAISSVHIYGESGSGKELVSELFEKSLDDNIPFNRIHCGAIAPTLLESELFGHTKGAFTGANTSKVGLIEQANGGWIFLDEVATLSPSAQIALLRVLDNQTIRPVGASKEKEVEIRVLSATNESLPYLVEQGKFRLDLWQRLCEATIELPPLRERMDEFEQLVDYFCKSMAMGPFEVAPSALDILKRYDWKNGNIRELRNCLRAMTEGAINKLLTPASIPSHIWKTIEPLVDFLASSYCSSSVKH